MTYKTPASTNSKLEFNLPLTEERLFLISQIEFKKQFKQLNYYSMPRSILFVVRKRLNFLAYMGVLFGSFAYSCGL
jgi:hypothetical protein